MKIAAHANQITPSQICSRKAITTFANGISESMPHQNPSLVKMPKLVIVYGTAKAISPKTMRTWLKFLRTGLSVALGGRPEPEQGFGMVLAAKCGAALAAGCGAVWAAA